MFVQLDWMNFSPGKWRLKKKVLILGLFFFFSVLRGKNNLTRWSRTTAKNSQHTALKGNMSPFEMVPFYGTCWFSGVYIFKVSWSTIIFHFYELYQYQYLRPVFSQCHHQDSYEFLGNRKKTELNRGGQAKQTNVVAWDSGSKRSE